MWVQTDRCAYFLSLHSQTLETWRRLNVLTTVVMWWNIHMLETETLQSDTPNLEEQNVKFCINPNLYSLCCLNWHWNYQDINLYSEQLPQQHIFQNVTNYNTVSLQCSGLIEKWPVHHKISKFPTYYDIKLKCSQLCSQQWVKIIQSRTCSLIPTKTSFNP